MQESTIMLTFTLSAVGAVTSAEEFSGPWSRWEQEWVARKESTQPSPGRGEGFRSRSRLAHLCTQVPRWGVLYPTPPQPAGPRIPGKGRSWNHWAAGPQRRPEPVAFSKLQGSCSAEAQECRAQHVSATVLTMLLRVPITTEMLPLSSWPQSISSSSFWATQPGRSFLLTPRAGALPAPRRWGESRG